MFHIRSDKTRKVLSNKVFVFGLRNEKNRNVEFSFQNSSNLKINMLSLIWKLQNSKNQSTEKFVGIHQKEVSVQNLISDIFFSSLGHPYGQRLSSGHVLT